MSDSDNNSDSEFQDLYEDDNVKLDNAHYDSKDSLDTQDKNETEEYINSIQATENDTTTTTNNTIEEQNDDSIENDEDEAEDEDEDEAEDQDEDENDENDEEEEEEEEEEQEEENEEENDNDEDENDEESKDNSDDSESDSESDDDSNNKIDFNLMEKQIKVLIDSGLLYNHNFKRLNKDDKITAIIKFLNSVDQTKFPNFNNIKFAKIDLSKPMSNSESVRYDEYLNNENKITEMSNIPPKSRLFIGNLPLKNVTKVDLFRIFNRYGHILQINIKNAFGFIQFDNPKSVLDSIKYELDHNNFNKKLILEVSSSNSRPQFDHGDHGTNSSSTFISTTKRPFNETDAGYSNDVALNGNAPSQIKRMKKAPQIVIFVKRTADRNYANDVFHNVKNGTNLDIDMVFLRPKMELRKLVNEVAYNGTWGVILINKTRNVDVQIFYKGQQGETKFDEYVSVSFHDAVGIFNNVKNNKNGNNSAMNNGMDNQVYPYGSNNNMPPPQHQGYGIPPPMGQQNQGYNMPPPPQQQAPPPPPPQQQSYQNYNMPPQQGGYGIQPPQPQQYGMPPQQNYSRYGGPLPPQQPTQAPQQIPQQIPQQAYGIPPQQPLGSQPVNMNRQDLQPQLSAFLNGNMNQQQLLDTIKNLPPDVVSSLLNSAQQQQQQQHLNSPPIANQQLQPPPQSTQSYPPPQQQQQLQSYSNQPPSNQQPPPNQQPPQSTTQSNQNGSNVQSLLDSLAQLQK